jgi:hypothetical protein
MAEALRQPPPPGQETLAQRVGHDTATGALDMLSSDEGLSQLSKIVETSVARSFEAALRVPHGSAAAGPGLAHGRRGGPGPRSVVERIAGDSATAASAAMTLELQRALGPDGHGPLADSLSATAEQVSGAAARGARTELGGLFPGCPQGDRACIEAGIQSFGRAAASGFVEGLLGSARWLALVLAFLVGLLVAAAVRGAARLVRSRRLA